MNDWQHALTAQVAENVEHFRHQRRLTRTQLADRCTALGLPTKRPALTALLDGHRQTVTLQELVVLAAALDSSVAELVIPLHVGGATVTGPSGTEDAFAAAQQLFAIPYDSDADGPYRLHLRLHRAYSRFERANRRLAELSHRIATGEAGATSDRGHPHPASEILATEAALSRLIAAHGALAVAGIATPHLPLKWDNLNNDRTVPLLGVITEPSPLLPLYVYRLASGQLPEPRLMTSLPS